MAAPVESLHMPDRAHLTALWDEGNTLMIDSLYSARSNQFAAQRWATVATWLGLPTSILSAILAAGAAGTAINGSNGWTVVLTVTVAVLNAIRSFLHPEQTLRGYQNKGAGYLALRNDARLFRDVDLRSSKSIEDLMSQLHNLAARRNALNGQPPLVIPKWAFKGAQKSIAAGESDYRKDSLWEEAPF